MTSKDKIPATNEEPVKSTASGHVDEDSFPDISIFDPKVSSIVKTSIVTMAKSIIFLTFVFVLLLLLFCGMSWNPKDNYKNVKIAFVDLDGGIIGQILSAVGGSASFPFSATILTDVLNLDDIKRRVNDGEFNAALVANVNSSKALTSAVVDHSAEYLPAIATSFIFDEGRGGSAMASALRASIPILATSGVNSAVAKALLKKFSDPTKPIPLSLLNSKVLINPVGNTEINLHPVQYSGENSAAGLGFIDNWVIAMITVNVVWAFHMSWEDAGIRRQHQTLSNLACLFFFTFFLALWPPAILRAFGAPIGADRYFRMWGFIWLAMITFGSVILALYRCVGFKRGAGFQGLFMLINFIASPGLNAQELLYPPFLLGHALPLQNAMVGTRTILFGSYDILGRCIGVLCGWLGLSLCYLLWDVVNEMRKQKQLSAAPPQDEDLTVVTVEAGAGPAAQATKHSPSPSPPSASNASIDDTAVQRSTTEGPPSARAAWDEVPPLSRVGQQQT